MIVNQIAIDVIKRRGVCYIKVVDSATGRKRIIFNMNLELVSSNVDIIVVKRIKKNIRKEFTFITRKRKGVNLKCLSIIISRSEIIICTLLHNV